MKKHSIAYLLLNMGSRDPGIIVRNELTKVWMIARLFGYRGETGSNICRACLSRSFRRLTKKLSPGELDRENAWPRYLKAAAKITPEPVGELLEYARRDNYRQLTQRLKALTESAERKEDSVLADNIRTFSEEYYHHVLDTIDPLDVPSCLALGKLAEEKGEYTAAREWFSRLMDTPSAFSGITSLLSSYEREIRQILSERDASGGHDRDNETKIKELNRSQRDIFDEWLADFEARREASGGLTDRDRTEYVQIVSKYARTEKNQKHFSRAVELLESIPEDYPLLYRKYMELGLIYQDSSYLNDFYNSEKAAEYLTKADICGCEENIDKYSRKSVLMPLAYTLFGMGRYDEADRVCGRVLEIDRKERRAAELRKRIAQTAAELQ